MKTLELKDIAGYLPWGLRVLEGNSIRMTVGIYGNSYDFEQGYSSPENGDITKSKPILRPMSDLSMEITDKNYDGGKPFVPIVELAKIAFAGLGEWEYLAFSCNKSLCCCNDIWYVYDNEDGSFLVFDRAGDLTFSPKQRDLFAKLAEWKFDYRGLITEGLAIDVNTLPENPYEK